MTEHNRSKMNAVILSTICLNLYSFRKETKNL